MKVVFVYLLLGPPVLKVVLSQEKAFWTFMNKAAHIKFNLSESYDSDYLCSPHIHGIYSLKCQQYFQSLQTMERTSHSLNEDAQLKFSQKLKDNLKYPQTSAYNTFVKDTVPWPQVWSRCDWCSIESGQVMLHDPNQSLRTIQIGNHTEQHSKEVLLEQSKWKGFFYETPNQFLGHFVDDPFIFERCDTYVDKPAFIFRILTWQVGHLLVDILEPLYHTMVSAFGAVNTDVYIFLDVAGKPESGVLFRKMLGDIDGDTPFSLLRMFTKHPIYTVGALFHLAGRTCFTEGLHFGLDIQHSYYAHGFDFHPSFIDLKRPRDRQLARYYKDFRSFLLNALGLYTNANAYTVNKTLAAGFINQDSFEKLVPLSKPQWSPEKNVTLTYIARRGARGLINEARIIEAMVAVWKEKVNVSRRGDAIAALLEEMPLSSQLAMFSKTSIFVAQYGSGAHNVVFLPPGSVLVLLVQPGWCDWAWIFANQAVLSGIHVFVYCDEQKYEGIFKFRWHHKGWLQGPFDTKYTSHSVDLPTFKRLIAMSIDTIITQEKQVVAAAVHHVEYKSYPRAFSQLPGIPCGMQDGASLAWVHLGPVEMTSTSGGNITYSVVPSVYTTMHPTKLMRLFPRLAICFKEAFTTAESCFESKDFNEFSVLRILAKKNNTVFMTSWLRDLSSGNDIEGSRTTLPISKDRKWSYLEAGNFTMEDERRVAILFELDKIERFMSVKLGEEGMVQRSVSCLCKILKMDGDDCAIVAKETQKALDTEFFLSKENLPSIQVLPTPKNPFFFFHLEKTGGTTLRDLIVQAAKKQQFDMFVPCYDGYTYNPVFCYQFTLKELRLSLRNQLSLVAGHFHWMEWKHLPQLHSAKDLSCFVMLRDPVTRIISYYYDRVFHTNNITLNNLGPQQLEYLMLKHFNAHPLPNGNLVIKDEGMINVGCKMMCGSYDYLGKEIQTDVLPNALSPTFSIVEAKNNLQQCVIGVLEHWEETKLVIDYWFPWMKYDVETRRHIKSWKGRETPDTLKPELKQIILKYNQCDVLLYEAGLERFRRQIQFLYF